MTGRVLNSLISVKHLVAPYGALYTSVHNGVLRPVYGDTLNADGTPKRQHVVRRINPAQAKSVVRIFESYASGIGLSGIAKSFNEEHIAPPHGGQLGWCPTAIRDILKRDLYRCIIGGIARKLCRQRAPRSNAYGLNRNGLRMDAPGLRIVSDVLWDRSPNGIARTRRPISEVRMDDCNRVRLGRIVGAPICSAVSPNASPVEASLSPSARARLGATMYRCAYNHKRGARICSNKTQVRQDALDSAILHAISEALDKQILEASVAAALKRLREREAQYPDQRTQP